MQVVRELGDNGKNLEKGRELRNCNSNRGSVFVKGFRVFQN